MKAKNAMKAPKDPRVTVKPSRHIRLAAEAKRRGMTIAQLAEEKFKKAS